MPRHNSKDSGIDWGEPELLGLFPLLPLRNTTEKWGAAIAVLLLVVLIIRPFVAT